MKKVKVSVGGQTLEAEKMLFHPIEEPWGVYGLEDGTTFRLRTVVMDVFRLPTKDPVTGLPQLMVQSTTMVTVEPPDTPLSKRDIQ